jgi:N-acetylglucosamine-6-phosphate deacetylase
MMFKIINGKIITPYRIIENGALIVENEKIKAVEENNPDIIDCDVIDADGYYISPGFIDIHVHGGGGHDFMDGTVESYIGASETHAQFGTTSMMPTTTTSSPEDLKKALTAFNQAKELKTNGANLLGLHLEGPYFSIAQCGAQDTEYIKNPNPEEYQNILNWSDYIKRWSAAPELEGAIEFGRFLRNKGILVSIAHSDAIYEQVIRAFENGFTHITHLYSSTSGLRRINAYRYAGIIESAFIIDEMTVEIIADGCHLPESLLKLIYKSKGADKIALITDAIRFAGMPVEKINEESTKGDGNIIVEDGVAKLADRTSFAGSIATCDRLVSNMINMAGVPLIDAVKMITSTPAKIVGANNKGVLAPGKDADIIIFDENINIKTTIINGKIIKGEGGNYGK